GAGSACGKALGALPSTTVGYERKFAWWATYLERDDEQGFIDELLDGQPDAHAYFARMKRQNKQGPAILGRRPTPGVVGVEELTRGLKDGTYAIIDTRPVDQVHAGTVPGALSIPSLGKAATHIAWAFDPETDDAELVVLAEDAETATEYGDHFVRVGVDSLTGYVTSLDGLPTTVPAVVSPAHLEALRAEDSTALLLDVRNRSEHADGTITGAEQLSAGKVLFHQDDLPDREAGRLITFCQSGLRNSVAASTLRRAGYDVVELDGSYAAWSRWTTQQHDLATTGKAARSPPPSSTRPPPPPRPTSPAASPGPRRAGRAHPTPLRGSGADDRRRPHPGRVRHHPHPRLLQRAPGPPHRAHRRPRRTHARPRRAGLPVRRPGKQGPLGPARRRVRH